MRNGQDGVRILSSTLNEEVFCKHLIKTDVGALAYIRRQSAAALSAIGPDRHSGRGGEHSREKLLGVRISKTQRLEWSVAWQPGAEH